MSKRILKRILEEMGIFLPIQEEEDLHQELVARFSIIGMANEECEALEMAWIKNEEKIENFILEWLKKRAEEKKKRKKKKKKILVEA